MLDVVVAEQGGEQVEVRVVDPVRQTPQLNATVTREVRFFDEWTRKPVATVDLLVVLLGLGLAPELLHLLVVAALATGLVVVLHVRAHLATQQKPSEFRCEDQDNKSHKQQVRTSGLRVGEQHAVPRRSMNAQKREVRSNGEKSRTKALTK